MINNTKLFVDSKCLNYQLNYSHNCVGDNLHEKKSTDFIKYADQVDNESIRIDNIEISDGFDENLKISLQIERW